MPRPRKSVPAYSHFKPRDLAYVRVPDGKGGRRVIYLGKFDSPESHSEYRRVLGELQADPARPVTAPAPSPAAPLVNEVLVGFVRWAGTHYRDPDGRPTSEVDEVKRSLAPLRKLYGHTPADRFGPLGLKAVRQEMVAAGWCRTLVNHRIERIKRAFKWAASEELVPVAVHQALRTVAGLARGRTAVRESEPVAPVDPAHVAATLPHLNRHVRAMAELQRLTGMRPGEVCGLRLADVDRSGDVWLYRPARHKTAHRGKARVIPLGPKARAVLVAFVAGGRRPPEGADAGDAAAGRAAADQGAAVFSPRAAREERYAAMRAGRKTKVQPSQVGRRKENPKRRPGERYTRWAYAHAVAKAAERAGVPHWHPNQLRHLFATEVRKAHGLEAAQVLLGHSQAKITEVYANRDLGLAARVATEIG